MKKFDLESELKRLRVPERGEEFWEAFPERVAAELRASPQTASFPRSSARRPFLNFRVALACLAVGFCLWESHMPAMIYYDLKEDETELRQTVRQLPNDMRRLMQDEHGQHKLIEDLE